MEKDGLVGFFETFLAKESLFINKKALQSTYIPENVLHRGEQVQQIAKVLAPALRLERPSNLFIYGKTGSGKTLSVKHTATTFNKIVSERDISVRIIYVNCKLRKTADTEYRLIAHLARELRKEIPVTGLPTEEVYNIFFKAVDFQKQLIVLVLDEIDHLVKRTGDEMLYNLTRINDELMQSQIAIIGISNDMLFADNLDPRIKSSLSEESLIFPPYNAIQLQNILKERAVGAFKEGAVLPGVIEKCAAYAARDHGDARRALELLRVAGELAERSDKETISLEHIDRAEDKIDNDKIVDIVTTQPKQIQATLYSVFCIDKHQKTPFFTGEVYATYLDICKHTNLKPLTQRRISDIITELDMFGLIGARVVSKGRYGKTREILLSLPPQAKPHITKILENALGL